MMHRRIVSISLGHCSCFAAFAWFDRPRESCLFPIPTCGTFLEATDKVDAGSAVVRCRSFKGCAEVLVMMCLSDADHLMSMMCRVVITVEQEERRQLCLVYLRPGRFSIARDSFTFWRFGNWRFVLRYLGSRSVAWVLSLEDVVNGVSTLAARLVGTESLFDWWQGWPVEHAI